MDSSKWAFIPPPEFVIYTSPSSVDLRAEEQRTIEVQLKSTKGFEAYVHLYSPNDQAYYMKFDFQYDNTRIPSFGIATVPLTIQTSPEALRHPYTMLLSAAFAFPAAITPFLSAAI